MSKKSARKKRAERRRKAQAAKVQGKLDAAEKKLGSEERAEAQRVAAGRTAQELRASIEATDGGWPVGVDYPEDVPWLRPEDLQFYLSLVAAIGWNARRAADLYHDPRAASPCNQAKATELRLRGELWRLVSARRDDARMDALAQGADDHGAESGLVRTHLQARRHRVNAEVAGSWVASVTAGNHERRAFEELVDLRRKKAKEAELLENDTELAADLAATLKALPVGLRQQVMALVQGDKAEPVPATH
jgi:hypothetical protein